MKNLYIPKKFFIALLIFAIAMMILGLFVGCTTKQNPDGVKVERNGEYIDYSPGCDPLEVIHLEYNGHKYILFNSYHRLGVIHDPDCPCHKKQDSMFNW